MEDRVRPGPAATAGQAAREMRQMAILDGADDDTAWQLAAQAAIGWQHAEDAKPTVTPVVTRPNYGSTIVLAFPADADEGWVSAAVESLEAAVEGDGLAVVTVRGVEALRTWEPPAPPAPVNDAVMAENRELRHLNAAQGFEVARLRGLLGEAGIADPGDGGALKGAVRRAAGEAGRS